ncbi:polyketide synthase, partial [Penicillium longicatenatum]
DTNEQNQRDVPIAIVGFSSLFPGDGADTESFWQMLLEKQSAMTESPEDRVNMKGWYYPETGRRGRMYARGANFLREDVSLFDAPFFSLSAEESSAMDPQQRHLLEVTYRALENAGIPIERVSGTQTSVHVGCSAFDYRNMRTRDLETTSDYDSTGVSASMAANRISWFFDCRGPSIMMDTACSSSLVALDMAVQGLQSGENCMGIVAGSNLILSPDSTMLEGHATMLSPDSTSYSFDHRANGFSRGEGTATVIIKRLTDAIRDGDTIRAVVRSTGSNNNGHASVGIMQPSEESQVDLIRHTYEKASLDMAKTRFCEAHGTGTVVGDSIEMAALGRAFQHTLGADRPLIVGAVKPNIGHLEGASGLAGVIKTVLALEKGAIPPNTNFERFSDKIDASRLNVKVPLTSLPWPVKGLRRASVNSFGIGGSNAHAVLDDALNYLRDHGIVGNHNTVDDPNFGSKEYHDAVSLGTKPSSQKLLIFSNLDQAALKRSSALYKEHFQGLALAAENTGSYLENLAFTLNSRRSVLPYRGYLVASSLNDLRNAETLVENSCATLQNPKICFAFTGQGAVWAGMGNELLAYPLFKSIITDLEADLREMGFSWSLLDIIANRISSSDIDNPIVAQTANTALQIALTDLYAVCGVHPETVIGHSSGEIAAAYACGALSATEALTVAYSRGLCISQMLSSQTQTGGMIAVGLGEQDARTFIARVTKLHGNVGLDVACINSWSNVTVSGDISQINTLKTLLDSEKIFARKINVSAAYHSLQMEPAITPYKELLSGLDQGITTDLGLSCPMVSSVTGVPVLHKTLRSSKYWCDNLLSPVRFADAYSTTRKSNVDSELPANVFLEIGPHAALKSSIRDPNTENVSSSDLYYSPSVVRNKDATQTFLASLGQLYTLGCSVVLEKANRLDGSIQKHPKVLTDLPSYSFDHSKSYWRESRISKQFRLGNQGHHDLLGKPIADWNAAEAQWRNFIKVSDLPWLEDHIVGGTLIYPAAGMMAMAIEAVKQITDRTEGVTGYSMKDVRFMQAMMIPEGTGGLETKLHLRRTAGALDTAGEWADFRIFSHVDNQWKEHCTGFIRQEYSSSNEVEEAGQDLQILRRQHQKRDTECVHSCEKSKMYKCLIENGFGLGPAFQTVEDARYNIEGDSIANISVYQWPERLNPQSHVIHPTTLDGALQVTMAAMTQGGTVKVPTAIPTSLRKIWIAKDGLSCTHAQAVAASGHTKAHGRGYESDITAMNTDLSKILLKVEGFQSTSISSSEDVSSASTGPKGTCLNVKLLPAFQFMSPQIVDDYCTKQLHGELADPGTFYQDVHFILFKFLQDALKEVGDSVPDSVPAHLGRYLQWAASKQKMFSDQVAPFDDPAWSRLLQDEAYVNSVCQKVASFNVEGSTFVHIGKNLPSILHGEKDVLQFLYEDGLLHDFYDEWNKANIGFKQLEAYLELLAHENPEMNIIEIGAGTGGTTRRVMHGLSTGCGLLPEEAMFGSYEYTDISAGFFEKAQKTFHQYPRMSFRTLDVEKNIAGQQFATGTYDLVIAGSVLHATQDIAATMRNVRSLLKPGGKLMMLELVHPEVLRGAFLGGLMEGWWTNDPTRPWNPTLTVPEWHKTLQSTGFSGVDIEFPDHFESKDQESSILIGQALELPLSTNGPRRLVEQTHGFCFIGNPESECQREVFNSMQDSLKASYPNAPTDFCTLRQRAAKPNLPGSTIVFLGDLDKALLDDLDESSFNNFRAVTASCENILWVSAGGGESGDRPECCIVDGWARSFRSEHPTQSLIVLKFDLQRGNLDVNQKSQLSHVLGYLVDNSEYNRGSYEPEIIEINGLLHIPRVQSNSMLKENIFAPLASPRTEMRRLDSIGAAQLGIGQCGLLDTLRWMPISSSEIGDVLLPEEVEIQVEAVGLNFKDCLMALGRVPETTLGLECAGTVRRAGIASDFQPGNRVLSFGPGLFKTVVRVSKDLVTPIPESLTFAEAAAIPAQFLTAWRVIACIGKLKKSESVLIHAGAGGTGQAAIQVAQYIGSEVYATVGSREKKEILMREYNIPADHIFYSRNTSFAEGIMRSTNGRGVDVIMNSLAGHMLHASWECIAAEGRFVEIGRKDILSNGNLPMAPFARNATFTAFEGSSLNTAIFQEDSKIILDLFRRRVFHVPRPLHVLKVDEVEEAFRSLQKGSAAGKFVLTMDPDSVVPCLFQVVKRSRCSPDATYVVSGGLGGLGRRVARWLVSCGACNLVLIGRSGAKSPEALELISKLEQRKIRVRALPCDIVDQDAVQQLVDDIDRTMPPVRGCIQAAMVLRDRMWQDMTVEDWHSAVNCKTVGSWNLAQSLPSDLDFFVMLSSCSALIGPPGQANYSAGNSYMDGLARHLVLRGRKAISLDLGVMRDDGFLAEDPDFMKQVLTYGALETVRREDFFAILDYYCNPDLPPMSSQTAQVAIGVPHANSNGKLAHLVRDPPIFRQLRVLPNSSSVGENGTGGPAGAKMDYRKLLREAPSPEDAREVVFQALVEKLKKICNLNEDNLDSNMHVPLTKLGVDSLVAVELGNWLKRLFEADVAVFELMGEETLSTLSLVVTKRSELCQSS